MEKPGEPPAYSQPIPQGTQPTQYPHPAISPMQTPMSTGAEHQQHFQQPNMGYQQAQQPAGAPPGGFHQGNFHQGSPQQPNVVYQQPSPSPQGHMMYEQPRPGMPQQQSTGALSQPQSVYKTVVPLSALSVGAAPIDCPACHQRGLTSTRAESGDCTHLWALGFCLVICLPCIPYLVDSFKDVQHKCGKCGVTVATYKRSGGTQVHVFQ